MTYFIYRLSTSSGQPSGVAKLTARGLGTIFTADHPEMAAYIKKHPGSQCLYLAVGEGNPSHTSPDEMYVLRGYSPFMCLNPRDVRRLLSVRGKWSRR
jgi:hypothetical protein